MHILVLPSWYVNSFNSLSGIFFKEQAEALSMQGHQVGVVHALGVSLRFLFRDKKLPLKYNNVKEKGVQTLQLEYPIFPKMRLLNSRILLWVQKMLIQKYFRAYGAPDIVHVHSFAAGRIALWIKEVYGVPYVVTEHSSGFAKKIYNKEDLHIAAEVFRGASYNIAVSRPFADLLERETGVLFDDIPNGVDTDFFIPGNHERTSAYRFVNVGFLNANKNQLMLIRAFSEAFENDSDVTLVIAGDGEQYNVLHQEIAALGMQSRIHLFGRASREEVKILMQDSDCFVMASQYETFGVVIAEAMSCGLPVVATKCGGPECMITKPELGILCDIDQKALKNALLAARQQRFDPADIRFYAIAHFSQKAVASMLIKIFKNVIQTNSAKAGYSLLKQKRQT